MMAGCWLLVSTQQFGFLLMTPSWGWQCIKHLHWLFRPVDPQWDNGGVISNNFQIFHFDEKTHREQNLINWSTSFSQFDEYQEMSGSHETSFDWQ